MANARRGRTELAPWEEGGEGRRGDGAGCRCARCAQLLHQRRGGKRIPAADAGPAVSTPLIHPDMCLRPAAVNISSLWRAGCSGQYSMRAAPAPVHSSRRPSGVGWLRPQATEPPCRVAGVVSGTVLDHARRAAGVSTRRRRKRLTLARGTAQHTARTGRCIHPPQSPGPPHRTPHP